MASLLWCCLNESKPWNQSWPLKTTFVFALAATSTKVWKELHFLMVLKAIPFLFPGHPATWKSLFYWIVSFLKLAFQLFDSIYNSDWSFLWMPNRKSWFLFCLVPQCATNSKCLSDCSCWTAYETWLGFEKCKRFSQWNSRLSAVE